MSVKPDHSEDEEGNHGLEVPLVETNRFGFILGNGETDSDGPCPELVRHRESKWLSLMTQWEQVMEKKSHKVKGQCQKGIPASVRAKCWPLLCGAKNKKEKNCELYKHLVKAPDHQGWTEIIKRDTDRQFPFHEMFQSKDGHGQKDLLDVLKAYTQYRPDEGYCQAQGPVAAVLLMNMPAEEAFWCLVQISELLLPGYYSPLLEGVLFDAAVLSSVLKKLCPAAHKHLQNQGVEPLMFATDWLMCLYSRHLPFNTLLRVWDLFFCYGVRVLFQVAVVLVRRCLGEARQRKECDGQMETLERLRGVKQHVQNEQADAFIHEVCSVSLSLADLQKQTEKELEKWKKDRPTSTFDPRGRCHGHRMVWERAQDKQKEQEKKERPKGSLSIPIMRSHSSLSPSLLRKKWRKRSSKTDTEEWDGGGRKFSQSLMEESDVEEIRRRRSLCTFVGEQRAKQDRLSDELLTHKHKDHNTHPKISQIVSSSIDSDVFEKEHSETSLNQKKDESEKTLGDHTGRTHSCEVEESIQIAEKDKNQEDMNTEAPTNQNEQISQDEQTVEIKRTSDPCEESTPAEKEDKQTDSTIQEEEIQSECNIQEAELQTKHNKQLDETEDKLPQVLVHKDSLPIISETDVVQEKSGDEHSEQQEELDLNIHTTTEDKETQLFGEKHTGVNKGLQQEFNVPPETTQMCEEKEDEGLAEDRQGVSLQQKDNHPFSGDKEIIQASESVLTSSSLQTEQEIETKHPERSTDPIQQSQSTDLENNDMDIIIITEELSHCPVDSTVGDSLGSGNPGQGAIDATDNTFESQAGTLEARLTDNTSEDTENNSGVSENTECCEVKTELCDLTHSAKFPTCESTHLLSNSVPVTSEVNSENNVIDSDVGSMEGNDVKTGFENNMTDVTTGSENAESSGMKTADEPVNSESNILDSKEIKMTTSDNPEHSDVHVKTESGNLENDIIDLVAGSDNLKITRELIIAETHPVCDDEPVNPDSNKVDSAVCYPENSNVPITNACNDDPISCLSGDPGSNVEDLAEGLGNQDNKEVHVTAFPEKQECNEMEIASGSVNSDGSNVENSKSNIVIVTPESGSSGSTTIKVENQNNKDVIVITGPEKTQSNEMEIATESLNSEGSNVEKSESDKILVIPESGNPESNDIQVMSGNNNPESKVDLCIESGDTDNKNNHVVSKSDHPDTNKADFTSETGNPTKDSAAGSDKTEFAIPANFQGCESPFPIQPSKSPHPNIPPNQLRVRRTSSSKVCYPTILSEDTFREPQQQEHTHTEMTTHTLTDDTNIQPTSPTKSGAQKRLGLFRRLRGENSKTPIPKILIQDFSEKDERLTSKERRRRKRENERKEREEKERKKREKELEKEKEKERKKPQTRGKSFQVLSKKGVDNTENSDSQTPRLRRNSAPFSDSYF